MNLDETATAFNKDNRIISHSMGDEDDGTDNNDEEYTISKSHSKPYLPTPESKRPKMRMTVRLSSPLLKLAITLASQIEQQPSLPDLCPQIILLKFAEKRVRLVKN